MRIGDVIYFFNDFRPYYDRVLAVIGVLANVVAIVTLTRGRCGLSKGVTWYLVAMAGVDLLVVVFQVVLQRGFYFHYTPECNIIDTMGYMSVACSVWLTVAFTLDRTVTICFEKLKSRYCTEKSAAIVIAVVSVLSVLTNIPWYFMYQSYFCMISYEFKTYLGWQIFDWGQRILTPVVPFMLILLLNAVTVRHILMASVVRRKLRGQRDGEGKDDPEMKNRRRSIILLFTISASFILLWMTQVVILAVQRITGQYIGMFSYYVVGDNLGTMLQLFSSCTNMFIYAVTQRKFREEMINTVKCPFTAIQTCIKP
ncbi:prolactin-releasing peptide receptor-like [Pristis pectinata]|uniref:prolactin-releasing peptide receptor-like n=1 Tax=Pristis pectinata TaxID=685728 RepID=UPI00223E3402|nr:prolactin-releasing peptide receptor-like [Pristis pectinata]